MRQNLTPRSPRPRAPSRRSSFPSAPAACCRRRPTPRRRSWPGSSSHFFEGSWVCAGTADELAQPGDQTAVRVGRDGILLVRGEDDRCAASTTSAATAPTSCCRPASAATSTARSAARTTAGPTSLDGTLRPRSKSHHAAASIPRPRAWCRPASRSGTAGSSSTPRATRRPSRSGSASSRTIVAPYEPERLRLGAMPRVRDRLELEADLRELPRVLPLPADPPAAVPRQPARQRRQPTTRPGAFVGGSMDMVPSAVTMSFDGHSDGVMLRGLAGELLREVHYYHLFSNVLLSLPPRLRDDAPHGAVTPEPHEGSSASGCSRPRPSKSPASARSTPRSSGTRPTGRTGARSRACSAASSRAATSPARSRPARTRCTTS